MNAYAKFGQNPSKFSQDIEPKQKCYGWTDGQTDGPTSKQYTPSQFACGLMKKHIQQRKKVALQRAGRGQRSTPYDDMGFKVAWPEAHRGYRQSTVPGKASKAVNQY